MSQYRNIIDQIAGEDMSLSGEPEKSVQEVEKPKRQSYSEIIDDLAQQEQDTEINKLRDSLYYGVKKSPEGFAEVVKLSREMGLPIPTVERNKDRVGEEYRLRQLNPYTLKDEYPETARFLMNPSNAGIMTNEIMQAARTEGAYADFTKGGLATSASNFLRGASRTFTETAQAIPTQRADVAQDLLEGFDMLDAGFERSDILKKPRPGTLSPLFMNDLMIKLHAYEQADAEGKAKIREQESKLLDPRNSQIWEIAKGVQESVNAAYKVNPVETVQFWKGPTAGAFGSMFSFATTTAIFRSPTAVALMGAMQQQTSGFKDALEHGASIEDALLSGQMNIPGGLLEAVPLARMFDRIDDILGGGLKKSLLGVLKAGTEEALQESLQQFGENLIASKLVKYDEERGLFVGVEEGAAVGFTVGAITQFLLGALLGKKVSAPDVKQSLEQSFLDEMYDTAENLAFTEKAPETFKEYLQQVQETYGPDEVIYVPAEHVTKLVESEILSNGTETEQRIMDQYQEALDAGGDIVLPVADFIADIAANKEMGPLFRDLVRLSPDTFSNFEASSISDAPSDIQVMMEEFQKDAGVKFEVDTVINDVVDQLVSTGVVDRRQATTNAKIFSAYVATKAAKTGMAPSEIFEAMGLEVRGPQTSDKQDNIPKGPTTVGTNKTTGHDDFLDADVNFTRTSDESFTIKIDNEYSNDVEVSIGMGGVYMGDLILNREGEFVKPQEIVQAGNAGYDQQSYKPEPKDRKKFIDLLAEIEFQRNIGNMEVVEELTEYLLQVVQGTKSIDDVVIGTDSNQLYEPGQDFGDLTIEKTYDIEETGERVVATHRAQDLWDNAQQEKDQITSLLECLRA